MNPQLLIDPIVRQTMVLIAQLSTVDGVRSPLSHVADEVFVNLVRELESQGVGKKVIADMFGLALRSYRQKVQRLREHVERFRTHRSAGMPGAMREPAAEPTSERDRLRKLAAGAFKPKTGATPPARPVRQAATSAPARKAAGGWDEF